ncbi:MAG: PAS domain-containing protein, partial [Gemmatimonadota bacterium]
MNDKTSLSASVGEAARHQGAETQAAILNALPASLALIDPDGMIVAINDSWRRLDTASPLQGPDICLGQNYLDVLRGARGAGTGQAEAAALGIRQVLRGETGKFVIECPGAETAEQRWFQLVVTPLREDRRAGAVVVLIDITDRKRHQDIAEHSQEHLRHLIDGLGPSIFVGLMTTEGVMLEANRSALAAAGLEAEDILGKRFDETDWWSYSPEAQAEIRQTVARAARGEGSRYDAVVRVANNLMVDVDFCLQPLRDASGKVVFLVPSANVITGRKETENALRESNENFHLVVDNITDAFWIRSADMKRVHYVSPAFERIWGRTTESLHANPHLWSDFIVPEDRDRALASMAALTGDARSVDTEYRIIRPGGEIRWIRVRGFQVRDAADEVIRLTGIVTDVTEQRRAVEALRASTEEFSTLAESMPQIVWITRPDGGVVYCNQQWADYTGLPLEESYGLGWAKPFHPDDAERARVAWAHATTMLTGYSIECRMRRADGVYRWWLVRGLPQLDATGNVVKWFGTCTDIHDLK